MPLVSTHFACLTRRSCSWSFLQLSCICFNVATRIFLKIFGGHESFLWGHWYPCFGLLVTSPLGFKARVDPLLVCFLACVQWIPEIHLWCDTCWPLGGQHGSQLHSLHACSRGRMPGKGFNVQNKNKRHKIITISFYVTISHRCTP